MAPSSILVREIPYTGPVGVIRSEHSILGIVDPETPEAIIEKLLDLDS